MPTAFHYVLVAMTCVSGPAGAPDPAALAAAHALIGYELSVRAVHQRQRVSFERAPGDWFTPWISEQYADEPGRWWIDLRSELRSEREGPIDTHRHQVQSIDRCRVFRSVDLDTGGGIIRQHELEQLLAWGPGTFRGGHVHVDAVGTLGELLLADPGLVLGRDEASGLPYLEGRFGYMHIVWTRARVVMNPERGWAPERITLWEDTFGWISEELGVIEWTEVDGIHLPAVAYRDLYAAPPMGDSDDPKFVEHIVRIAKELDLTEQSDRRDPAVRARFREWARRAYPDGPPVKLLSPDGRPRIEIEYLSINEPWPADRFDLPYQTNSLMGCIYTGAFFAGPDAPHRHRYPPGVRPVDESGPDPYAAYTRPFPGEPRPLLPSPAAEGSDR